MSFDPVNLDHLSSNELRQLYAVFHQLAYYCEEKADAQDARLNGRILKAQEHERACENIYQQLPVWARW